MRHLRFLLLLAVASTLLAQEAPPPVPQAVAALEHLKPKTDAGPFSWTAGEYRYDPAGNITSIGSEAFVYDKLGRLKSATMRGPDLTTLQTQTFTYDEYGNLTSTAKLGQSVSLPVNTATNRLTTLGYDAAGNVVTSGTQHYDYDAVGMLDTIRIGSELQPRMVYAYTADDERLFAFDVSAGTTHWTLRGLDHKVLRDFKQVGNVWSVDRDYVYRDSLLLAALKPGGAVEHYTLDHLGTPRLITDGAGRRIGYHVYWPFGEEWSPGNPQEGSPLKFTGHERDADPTGGSAPLDSMHARFYGVGWGRFMAVDPVWNLEAAVSQPQQWNRYSYALGNPLSLVDPSGEVVALADLTPEDRNQLLTDLNAFTGNEYGVNNDGELTVISYGANASPTATAFVDSAIAAAAKYEVTSKNGSNVIFAEVDGAANKIKMDFKDFSDVAYNGVDQRAFGPGSTLIHELGHLHPQANGNTLGDGPLALRGTQVGPTETFVNQMRTERGLPSRGPAYEGRWGGAAGNRVLVNFRLGGAVIYVSAREYH
ncbi:MAG TPA: RHS repeat-associated core domain-containing protein [Thermoanaerobaculia bacterium]|nr:RHS repeat-associated core domain-containing protein [Thermoanaerobaculia bacterium]